MVFADALDSHLLPTVGDTWLPKGTQVAVMTPGTKAKHSLAGALDLTTGIRRHCWAPRTTTGLCRELLETLDEAYPAPEFQRVYVVVDNDKIQKAKAVEQGWAQHPRLTLLFLPTYCPRANPIERAVGDVHDLCTRNHPRKRVRDLVADVEAHLHVNGPWKYTLSEIDYEPAVTAAVENMAAEDHSKAAA
jgi:hypothetical protein